MKSSINPPKFPKGPYFEDVSMETYLKNKREKIRTHFRNRMGNKEAWLVLLLGVLLGSFFIAVFILILLTLIK